MKEGKYPEIHQLRLLRDKLLIKSIKMNTCSVTESNATVFNYLRYNEREGSEGALLLKPGSKRGEDSVPKPSIYFTVDLISGSGYSAF